MVEAKKRFRAKRWIFGVLVAIPFVTLALYPAPSLETTSPDGRLSCYVARSRVIFPYFAKGWIRVADLQTGETVNATGVKEGMIDGESPEYLMWSNDGRHFLYMLSFEPGGATVAYDVKTSPLRVELGNIEEAKVWAIALLNQKTENGTPEEKKRAAEMLNDLYYRG